MNAFKTFLVWLLSGALIGVVVASLVAPGILAWNNTPGEGQALCDCVKATRSTATDLLKAQLIGAGTGSVLSMGLALLLRRRKSHLPAPPSPASPG
jgi:hypothetical protein